MVHNSKGFCEKNHNFKPIRFYHLKGIIMITYIYFTIY